MWLLVTSKKYKVERTYKQERPYNSTSSAARVATTWELCYRDDSMRRARATPRTTALRHAAHARPRYASPTLTTPRHARRATLCASPICALPSCSACAALLWAAAAATRRWRRRELLCTLLRNVLFPNRHEATLWWEFPIYCPINMTRFCLLNQ